MKNKNIKPENIRLRNNNKTVQYNENGRIENVQFNTPIEPSYIKTYHPNGNLASFRFYFADMLIFEENFDTDGNLIDSQSHV